MALTSLVSALGIDESLGAAEAGADVPGSLLSKRYRFLARIGLLAAPSLAALVHLVASELASLYLRRAFQLQPAVTSSLTLLNRYTPPSTRPSGTVGPLDAAPPPVLF